MTLLVENQKGKGGGVARQPFALQPAAEQAAHLSQMALLAEPKTVLVGNVGLVHGRIEAGEVERVRTAVAADETALALADLAEVLVRHRSLMG